MNDYNMNKEQLKQIIKEQISKYEIDKFLQKYAIQKIQIAYEDIIVILKKFFKQLNRYNILKQYKIILTNNRFQKNNKFIKYTLKFNQETDRQYYFTTVDSNNRLGTGQIVGHISLYTFINMQNNKTYVGRHSIFRKESVQEIFVQNTADIDKCISNNIKIIQNQLNQILQYFI